MNATDIILFATIHITSELCKKPQSALSLSFSKRGRKKKHLANADNERNCDDKCSEIDGDESIESVKNAAIVSSKVIGAV